MAGSTTRLALYKPGGGSTGLYLPDETADIDKLNENSDKIDDAIGAKVVTSTTRPATPFDGQIIKETDTGRAMVWRAAISEWVTLTPGTIQAGSATLRDLIYPAPGTLAARVTLQNSGARWLLTATNFIGEQVYLAEYDAATNPNGAVSGAGWYVVRQYTSPVANKRSMFIAEVDDNPGTTSVAEFVSLTLPLTLVYPQLIELRCRIEWNAGANAAGTDRIRVTDLTGEVVDEFRSQNGGSAGMLEIDLSGRAYLPAGLTNIVYTSNHEGGGVARTINVAQLEAWAV